MKASIFTILILFVVSSSYYSSDHRKHISLNGVWGIAKTNSFGGLPSE